MARHHRARAGRQPGPSGNELYLYAADVFAPTSCHVFQVWQDRASLEAHIADPHHRQHLAALDELGARWSSVTHYEVASVLRKR